MQKIHTALFWFKFFLNRVEMDLFTQVFGEGKELNTLQMCTRGIVIFFIALLLIRLSGRRSFGLRTPLDNIISILLGAILSRAVTGASPFVPVISVCFLIVLLHRFFTSALLKNKKVREFCEGKKILLFENGVFIQHNLTHALVSKEDILQAMRISLLSEDFVKIEKIYMERNGKISIVKKKSD
jgi:uncharacterized membrane protein YcaP (DUF421 family)